MTTLSIEEVKSDLERIIVRVQGGETVIVTRSDHPVAEIAPVSHAAKATRPFGLCKGEFVVPDDFDDPLPDDMIRSFEAR